MIKQDPMSDLIDRQAAIDALISEGRNVDSRYISAERIIHESDAIEAISMLPSAEPEIIRCEYCRWGREACGNIECFVDSNIPPEYHGYEWFCPNGERR